MLKELPMPRNLLIASVAIAALSLAACNKKAETQGAATPAEQAQTPDANPAATVPTPQNESKAMDFVPKAAASDMFEIAAAKVALKRSTSTDVKKFAQMMIDAHTKSTAGLKKAIADSGQSITPPAALPADLQGKLDDLNKADAKDFNKDYVGGQVDAHQGALDLIQRYAQDGDVDQIKTWAAATAPVVQQHLNSAKSLKDAMK
jgi:putative membrane protein